MTDGDGTARSEQESDLTHTDAEGQVDVVDVGDKPDTARRAVAHGRIRLDPETVEAIAANELEKGDVLATARIGAIQAVKHTWETIPLCHQIPITNVETEFDLDGSTGERETGSVELTVAVETTGKTGCEMEALEGVTTGLNVVWDMVKSAEKDAEGGYPTTRVEGVEIVEKIKREIE